MNLNGEEQTTYQEKITETKMKKMFLQLLLMHCMLNVTKYFMSRFQNKDGVIFQEKIICIMKRNNVKI